MAPAAAVSSSRGRPRAGSDTPPAHGQPTGVAQGADSYSSACASPAAASSGGARAGRATGRSVGRPRYERNQAQAAAAPRTRQHIEAERAPHQSGPALTPRPTSRRIGRGGRARLVYMIAGRRIRTRCSARHDLGPPGGPGPRTPEYRIRLTRGRGTSTASRPRNSTGSNTTCVVPSPHGCLSASRTWPSAVTASRAGVRGRFADRA